MKQLVRDLREADIAYYKYDDPKITDREYDKLYDELKALEEETSVVISQSPTQKVSGEILPELKSVRHTKPMLSAEKAHFVEELLHFAKGKDVLLLWKLDGLTLVLRYRDGKFRQAITRGREGIVGEDVTHTVKHFLIVPLTIPIKEPFEVRGEGVISWKHFSEINRGMTVPYKHPRGLAAGSVRKLDTKDVTVRKLEFFAFDLISDEKEYRDKRMHLAFLQDLDFS